MLMLYNRVMNKKIAYFAMSFTLLLNVAILQVAVHAQTEEMSTTAVPATQTPMPSSSGEAEVESAEDSAARPTRITNYKKNLKVNLTNSAKARIGERCTAAQAQLKVKKNNNFSVHATRVEAYDKIMAKLKELSASASAKGADVSALQTNITELQGKIVTFKTAHTPYQQALTDLTAIDCKADPVAFKAALEVARTNQTAVFEAAKAVRTYLKETVKPTLTTLKTVLESDKE